MIMKSKVTVHALSGSAMYRSDATLMVLKECLKFREIEIRISQIDEKRSRFPDLDLLAESDVMLVFCEDVKPDPEQLEAIRAWCRSGKPVIGVLAAVQAFRNWPDFNRDILGVTVAGSGSTQFDSRIDVEAFGHPVVEGLTGWNRPGRIYGNPQFTDDITVLLSETGPDGSQPAAWCRTHPQTAGRVFSTSFGAISDFGHSKFIDLLHRACMWSSGIIAGPSNGQRYLIAHLDETPATECSCGTARRAFMVPENSTASVHMVDISQDTRVHYHKKLTEIYLILEGEGHLELDGKMVPVRPLTTILIKPGCRHRAVGNMRIINIPVPPFDPSDEWYE